jgi:hypothetical protein
VTDGAIDASVPSQAYITLLAANYLAARWAVENRHEAAAVEEDDRLLPTLKTGLKLLPKTPREGLRAAFPRRLLPHVHDLYSRQRHLPDPFGEI